MRRIYWFAARWWWAWITQLILFQAMFTILNIVLWTHDQPLWMRLPVTITSVLFLSVLHPSIMGSVAPEPFDSGPAETPEGTG